MESWKNNKHFELNGRTLDPLLSGFSFSYACDVKSSCTRSRERERERMAHLFDKTQVASNQSGVLLYFFLKKESLSGISHTGNQTFSHSHVTIGEISLCVSFPSVLEFVILFHICLRLRCMLCLRMSSLSCSQAGNGTRAVRFLHVEISHMNSDLRKAEELMLIFLDS